MHSLSHMAYLEYMIRLFYLSITVNYHFILKNRVRSS